MKTTEEENSIQSQNKYKVVKLVGGGSVVKGAYSV